MEVHKQLGCGFLEPVYQEAMAIELSRLGYPFANVRPRGDRNFEQRLINLVFTVEEETTFKGVEAFIAENKGKIDHYVALDGGYEGFTYAGIGINWYRHHFIGPGGHTRSRTPPYSATLPLARAIERIYQLPVPTNPSSNLNIGMLGGADDLTEPGLDLWAKGGRPPLRRKVSASGPRVL